MQRITPVDIQHRTFKKALQGYDRAEVDQFLDEIIETLEDDAQHRAALEAEIADLKERISHFKAMEESLQNTLLLEADLIKEQARISAEREISTFTDAAADARREHQRANEAAEKARGELRGLLMTHLALLERATAPNNGEPAQAAPAAESAQPAAEEAQTDLSDTNRITVY